jgi:uncharacterized secreted protein with C-terminal beta-propeller domain
MLDEITYELYIVKIDIENFGPVRTAASGKIDRIYCVRFTEQVYYPVPFKRTGGRVNRMEKNYR